MQILVLMAGSDSAFSDAGYHYPKNLTEVAGKPLIEHVVGSLRSLLNAGARLVVCVKAEENRSFHTGMVLDLLAPGVEVVDVPAHTGGAACTALLAVDALQPEEPLIIVNGDQVVAANIADAIGSFQERNLDGGVIVFRAVHPRWSYVKVGPGGDVIEASEKRPISDLATAGVYYFRRSADFVAAAGDMLRKNASVNGVFFVCPAYNEMILRQKRIGIFEIPRTSYFSLSSPQGIPPFEAHLRSNT